MAKLIVAEVEEGVRRTRDQVFPTREAAIADVDKAEAYWTKKGAQVDRYLPEGLDVTVSATHSVNITVW